MQRGYPFLYYVWREQRDYPFNKILVGAISVARVVKDSVILPKFGNPH